MLDEQIAKQAGKGKKKAKYVSPSTYPAPYADALSAITDIASLKRKKMRNF